MKHTIQIQNLKCGGCANTIITKLNLLEGISETAVNVEKDEVSFNYTSEENLAIIYQKLKDLGYPIYEDDNSLGLKAKSYISCAMGRFKKEDVE